MKTKLLKSFSFLILLTFFLGCRNESLSSIADSEHQQEEFFAKLSQSLSNHPDGKKIIERIKQENQKSNFLEKINKRNGEAKLDQKILKKSFQLDKTGKSEDSIVYLNVPFGNSNYLTSVLFIEFSSSEFKVNEIDNIKLEEIVNDNSLSRESREELLINYLILDKSQYNSNEYINIPSALFPELKENTSTLSKSFKILNYTISPADSSSGRIGDTVVCIEYEDSCDHCSGLPTNWMCYSFGGGGGDDDGGNDGGGTGTGGNPGGDGGGSGGGDGTGTGNEYPENPDPCTDPNSPWYTHSSCGNNVPNAVMTLSQKMNNYGYNISSYLQYLTSNPSIRIGFATYLSNNTNQQGAAFVNWGLGFLSQNPDTTWAQFENWFVTQSEGQDGEYIANLDDIISTLEYQQKPLPSYSSFENNFPKLPYPEHPYYFKPMPANQVYNLVGGNLYNLYMTNNGDDGPYKNACATRVSLTLNRLGILIPNNSQSIQGGNMSGQTRYYIVNANIMADFLKKTFGNPAPSNILSEPDCNNPQKVADFLKGKTGIYLIINNDPSKETGAGYTGHTDMIKNGYVSGGANADGVKKGIKYIYIWELK